jgi:hypothetical protein
MPNGRRTLYTPQLCDEIVKRSMLGQWSATNEQIADYAGVDVATVRRWKAKHPEFRDAIRRSKVLVDNQVEGSLYHVAVSGNAYAMVKWLQCRRPNEWRDKQDIDLRTPDGFQLEYPVLDVEKMLNLSPEQKAEFSRTCRAYQEAVHALALMPATVVEVEPEED